MAASSKRAYVIPGLLHQEPLPLQQATADLYLHRRLSNTQRKVWLSLCGVSASWCTQGFVCALQESVSLVLWNLCNQIPFSSKVRFSGVSQSLCQIPVWEPVVSPRTFLTVQEFLWYNCSAVCGTSAHQLYGGVNGDFLQEGLRHRLYDPGSCTQNPCPCSRPLLTCTSTGDSNTGLTQSLCDLCVLVCTRFCLSPPSVSVRYGI